jgi:hypothetical protein
MRRLIRSFRAGLEEALHESAGGRFARDLLVNEAGFVIRYPDLWEMEASA